MRRIGAASLVAICGMLACAPARADDVPPFKGNDTGGIIAYPLAAGTDAVSVSLAVGGAAFSATIDVNVQAAPQVLTSVQIAATAS